MSRGRNNIRSLVGERFGKLQVLAQEVAEFKGKRQSVCHCLCDCGKEIDVPASRLQKTDGTPVARQTRSCGCAKIVGNLIGQRFGQLTVCDRSEAKNKSGETMWLCRCDCGNEKIISGSQLKRGIVQSCGCAVVERNERFAKLATVGATASHTPVAENKRTQTRFGAQGSDERAAQGLMLVDALRDAYCVVDGANVPLITGAEPMGTNPYRGVCWNAAKHSWMAYCQVRGKKWAKYGFDTPESAKAARDKAQNMLIEEMHVEPLIDGRRRVLKEAKRNAEN